MRPSAEDRSDTSGLWRRERTASLLSRTANHVVEQQIVDQAGTARSGAHRTPLGEARFDIEQQYGDFQSGLFADDSPEIITIAKRQ
jgi:hypothetical protein